VIDQHDAQLQRIFDERLMRVLPPPRTARRPRTRSRLIAAALAVALTSLSLGLAADVNRTADAAGESCASVLARVELWWDTVKNGTTAQQLEFKRQAGELVGQTCTAKGDLGGANAKRPQTTSLPNVKRPEQASPECVAAKAEAARSAESLPQNATDDERIALKQRLGTMLEKACS
jgi:hypothetical protein